MKLLTTLLPIVIVVVELLLIGGIIYLLFGKSQQKKEKLGAKDETQIATMDSQTEHWARILQQNPSVSDVVSDLCQKLNIALEMMKTAEVSSYACAEKCGVYLIYISERGIRYIADKDADFDFDLCLWRDAEGEFLWEDVNIGPLREEAARSAMQRVIGTAAEAHLRTVEKQGKDGAYPGFQFLLSYKPDLDVAGEGNLMSPYYYLVKLTLKMTNEMYDGYGSMLI